MDTGLFLAITGCLIFVAVLGIGYAVLNNPKVERRFFHKEEDLEKPESEKFEYLKKPERVLKPLGAIIPRSPEEMSRQERRLVKAGIRRKDASLLFWGSKIALMIGFLVLFSITGLIRIGPLMFVLLAVLLGAMLPDLWLKTRISRRTERIQSALPNALDLAVVCVEAGLGLDQSLMRIAQEMRRNHRDLSDELNLLGLEVNAGRKRADALRNLGNRTDSKDLKSLAAVLIQTDRFGTSIAQSLRTFADGMRSTRKLRAEEHAAKMSIKMLPPLIFFIFPPLFIIILGPAVISVIKNLLPLISGR